MKISYTTSGGVIIQSNAIMVLIADNITNPINLKTIITNRMKKEMSLPCQSYCPYIGTAIFLSQIVRPNLTLTLLILKNHHRAALLKPRLYHQRGKYKSSPTQSIKITFAVDTNKLSLAFIKFIDCNYTKSIDPLQKSIA